MQVSTTRSNTYEYGDTKEPHIGHLYTVVLADAAHRWATIKGAKDAIYSCGTDEHGAKVIAHCISCSVT